ncbi:serine dehydratase beta chain, partial [Neisseria meningitidis]|uniref:serine dehydratase beta chain n=1 Tax=Neisseria meningitidis TaxID=487 RepID=UPI000CC66435
MPPFALKKIFKIGIWPSSSHTVVPLQAAAAFAAVFESPAVLIFLLIFCSLSP